MPKELNKELVKYSDIGKIRDEGDSKVRLVFFNVNINNDIISKFVKMSNKDVTALKVSGDKDTGTVEFFEKEDNAFRSKGTSYYLKEPSLIGAIFTDNIEMYNCVMRNAFKKLNIVTQIYQKKTNNLKNFYISQGDNCANFHKLDNLNIILGASRTFNSPNIANINSASKALEQQNKQAQLYSCALIY
jgi:hypothetical protein